MHVIFAEIKVCSNVEDDHDDGVGELTLQVGKQQQQVCKVSQAFEDGHPIQVPLSQVSARYEQTSQERNTKSAAFVISSTHFFSQNIDLYCGF